MSFQHFRLHRPVRVVAGLILAAVLAPPPVPAAAEMLLNTTVRHAAIKPEPGVAAAARFRVELPQAGLLALGLTVPGGAPPEPVLRLLGSSLPIGIRATPTTLLVESGEAVTLLVEVAALESAQSLPAFKLRSAFRATGSEADVPIIDEVDPWDDDLGGKQPPGTATIEEEICALGEQDDHGDIQLCATPIDSPGQMTGEIHNNAGDDEDLFRFWLAEAAVLAAEAVSDSALQLVLRDIDGLAVAVARNESEGAPLRLACELAAGRYFLEVESLNGGDGVYTLILQRSSLP